MRHSLIRLGAALALALAACAKQQPLPVANFDGVQDDELTVASGQQIILSATSSTDPSGTGLTFDWSFVSLPRGSKAKIESPHNAVTRFTADVPTTVQEKYVLSLTVRNAYFVSAPRTLTITALECGVNAPVVDLVTATPTSINIATPVQLSAAVTDKDNDAACQASLSNRKQTEAYRWAFTSLPAGSRAALRDPAAEKASFAPDVAGTYSVALTVTDSTGRASSPARLDVQVAACGGAAPGVNAITSSPASPNLAQPTQLSADVADADNNPICGLSQGFTYAWSVVGLPRGSAAQLNDPAAVNPSFVPDVPGAYSFTLVATDSTGRSSAPTPFAVTVKDCGGAPPTPIVQLTPATAGIGQPVSLRVTPQDSDAACGISETFSYAWSLVTVPGGSQARIVAPAASAASLVPDVGGDYAINVTITDSRGSSASALSHLTVAACGNNPPVAGGLTGLPLTPLVGQNVHVTAQVSDADSSCAGFNPAQTFQWTLSMRPAGSGAALRDPGAAAADFTPDVIGHYQLSLVVTDATGLASAPARFDVQTSTCGSSAPQIASVGASSPAPDPGTPFTLFAQALDADNGVSCNQGQGISLLWEVASRPAGSSATLSDPAAATPSFDADVAGSYQFSVVATDSTGLRSAPAFLTLATTACGTAIPTVTAVPATATVQPYQTVNLAATPFDANTSCGINETFAYAWRIVSAPAGSGAIVSNPGAAAPTFVPDVAGAYQLSVHVSDGRGHVSPDAFVTVNATGCATLPPTAGALRSDPVSPTLGSPVTLGAPAAQANACFAAGASTALQYAWTLSRPAGSAATLDDPAAATPRFTPDVAGVYQAALVVRDSHGLDSTPAVLNLGVAPCGTSNLAWNPAPEIAPALTEPDGSALTPSLSGAAWTGAYVGTSVALSAAFADPPGCGIAAVQPFTYQWALVSQPAGSAAHLDSPAAAMPVFVPDLPGVYQVAARVSDALGAVLPTRFASIAVASCGSNLPVVAIAPPASTALSTFQPLPLQVLGGTATDADNTACPARFAVSGFSYSWSVSPAGASLASVTGGATSFSAGAPGTYSVQLVATAANGLRSAPATQVLTVGACGSHAPAMASVSTVAGGVAASRPLVGQAVSLTAFAGDADIGVCGDAITSYDWTVASVPTGSAAALSSPTGATVGFIADLAGTYRFTVTATDSFGLRSAPYTVTVETAVCAPDAPSITASTGAPAIGQAVTLSAAPPADACVLSPSFTYAWRVAAAPAGSAAPLSSSTGASVRFAPDRAGTYAFEVVATDQAGFSSAPALLQLGAGTCGTNPPLLGAIAPSPANGAFNAGDRVTLSSALTDTNAGCGALTQPYAWAWTLLSRPAGSSATLASSDAAPAFVPDLPGSYQVAAQVTDALGNVSAAVFGTVTTSPCGTAAPVATSFTASQALPSLNTSVGPAGLTIVRGTGAAQNADIPFYPGQPVALSATVTDADAACGLTQAVSYSWSLASAPPGSIAAILNPASPTPSLVPDVPGEYDVQLTVTDSTGLSSTSRFSTMPASTTPFVPVGFCGVQAPRPEIALASPVAAPGPIAVQSLPVGSQVVLDASGSIDADNDPLQLTSSSVPAGSAAAVSGCGLSQTLSYHWTVTAAPAAVQPLAVAHTDLANPSFTASVPGNYDLSLAVSDGSRSSSAPISIHARGIGSSTVTATPANGSSFVVGPAGGANIVTTVLDTDGNPLAAVPVSLAVTAGFTANTLAPVSGSTGSSGTFTGVLTSNKAGGANTRNGETKTVQAASGTATLGSVNVDFDPGPVQAIAWFQEPCDVLAGATICGTGPFPEVDGIDQYGNVNTTYTSPVSLTLQQQPNGSTLSGTLTQNAGTPFNDLNVDLTGSYQLLATVSSPPAQNTVLSRVFVASTPPANPPVITSSAATSPRQIVLNWSGSKNASNKTDKTIVQYHVFRAPGAVTASTGTFAEIAVPTIAGGVCGGPTSYTPCSYTDTDPSLADGTVYTYYVEADNNGVATCGPTTCSTPSNVTQQSTMPGLARNVTTTGGTSQITVSWNPPAAGTASSYDVLSASSLNGTYTAVNASPLTTACSGSSCSYVDTSVGTNATAFYKIRANITGAAAPAQNPSSSVTAAGVSGTSLPGQVTGLAASTVRYDSITLGWTAQSGVTYTVHRSSVTPSPPGSYQDAFSGVGTNSFVNDAATNLAVYPGVTYHYAVEAVNAAGAGPLSSDLAVTTPAAPWNASNGGLPGGGWINQIVVDGSTSPGTLYAATGRRIDTTPSGAATGGVFKFSPATSSWAPVNKGIPNGSVVTSIAAELQLGAVLKLYAGTDGAGVFASIDAGQTWNPITAAGLANGNVASLYVDNQGGATQGTLWVGGASSGAANGGIFSLPPGATAWNVSLAGPTTTVQAFAQDAVGGMWAQLASAAPGPGLYLLSAGSWVADPNQPAAGVTDCSPTRAGSSAFAIDFVPATPVIYWGSAACGLLSRPVSGTTWSTVAGYTAPSITRLALVDTGTAGAPVPELWVGSADPGAANGVTYIKDTAAPTVAHMTGGPASWEPTALASDFTFTPPTHLYAGAGDGSGAWFSTNANAAAGGSFARSNTGLSNLNVKLLIRDPGSTSNVFAAGDQFGVATSTNGGSSWTAAVPSGCTGRIAALAYDATSTTILALCQGQGIFQGAFTASTNTTTWSTVTCTGLPASPAFSSGIAIATGAPDKLYFATQGAPATVWTTDASGANLAKTCTALAPALPGAVTDVTALAVDANKAVYVASPGQLVDTLCTTSSCTAAGATWTAPAAGPKSVVRFFIDTQPTTDVIYAAGQDDGTGVGGAWSGAIAGVTSTTTIAWATVPAAATNVTSSSVVTGFDGLVTGGSPFLFAGTALTPGRQYANVFRDTGTSWIAAGDGIDGGNVLALTLPDAASATIGSTVVLAATSGGGIFRTTTGGR